MVFNDIRKYGFETSDCILIGDSSTDFEAAYENNVDFIFRGKENLSKNLNFKYIIEDFLKV